MTPKTQTLQNWLKIITKNVYPKTEINKEIHRQEILVKKPLNLNHPNKAKNDPKKQINKPKIHKTQTKIQAHEATHMIQFFHLFNETLIFRILTLLQEKG